MKTVAVLGALVASALVVATPTAAEGSKNVVPNPGFEVGPCSGIPNGDSSVFCNWGSEWVIRNTSDPHSGSGSLWGTNCTWRCYGSVFRAQTTMDVCVSIKEGPHPASFWYRPETAGAEHYAFLDAIFFQAPNCTGSAAWNMILEEAWCSTWCNVTGILPAPAGTKSALFGVGMFHFSCDPDDCPLSASFDDLEVWG
jgi:hypothetical protein